MPASEDQRVPPLMRVWWVQQVVERQGEGSMSVRLGSPGRQPQAWLEGFKSRVLQAKATPRRHLYATEWRSVGWRATGAAAVATLLLADGEAAREAAPRARPSPSVPLAEEVFAKLPPLSWSVVALAVATRRERRELDALGALESALAIVQAQATGRGPAPSTWLLTAGAQRGASVRTPAHAGCWGLARSARAEAQLPLRCIDGSVADPCTLPAVEPELVLRPRAPMAPRLVHASHPAGQGASSPLGTESHVVTGGTGGLGLLTSRWLAQHGASALMIASRSGALARGMSDEWAQLRASGAAALLARCDTAEAAHVRRLVALAMGSAPLKGVWHAAGLLADGVLPAQSAEPLARAHAPKACGGWALQQGGFLLPLCACTLFSSVAAMLGGAGQASYSAANAGLDALASHCRDLGRPCVSVQWGAWAEVGMAARGAASKRMAAMEAEAGFGRISLAQGLDALHIAVHPRAPALLGVMPVQWHRLLGRTGVAPAFLSDMAPRAPATSCASVAAVDRVQSAISVEAVLQVVQRAAGSAVNADAPLMEAGVDSLGAVELRNTLQRAVGEGVVLSSTLMFDHPTARQIALHMGGSQPDAPCAAAATARAAAPTGVCGAGSVVRVDGVSVLLPAAVASPAALRQTSHCGQDLLSLVPVSRWDLDEAANELGDSPAEVASRVRHGGFMCHSELFENRFFSISAAEAAAMDPQQRLLLERGYLALHAAGKSRASLLGAAVAVSVGQWASEFSSTLIGTPAGRSVYASTGYACSVTCGRVSFALGLHGPCASFDTACSASLVGNHANVRALQRSECDAALSAGVNMILDPNIMRGNAIAGFTSATGRSHTFDSRADGYARGEAILVTANSMCDAGGNTSLYTLGSAVRQDGRSASLTAPNGHAQQHVVASAIADAQLAPHDVAALEAHGTGTALGDPIEAAALAAVFLPTWQTIDEPLVVSSLKANAGHTEPGAGLAGAIKLIVQLQYAAVTPNAHLRRLNHHVGATMNGDVAYCMPVQTACVGALHSTTGLCSGEKGGVSSFGYSGTIAHAVLRHVEAQTGGVDGSGPPLVYRRHVFPWRHPPHPFAQRHVLSSEGRSLFISPAAGALRDLVADHVVDSRVIFPGAGYLEMARAAVCTLEPSAVSPTLQSVFFLQPMTVEAPGLSVECAVWDVRFEVRSVDADDGTSDEREAPVHCSGAFVPSGPYKGRLIDQPFARGRSCGHAVSIRSLYDQFDAARLHYGPGYRTLLSAWRSGAGAALSRLRARPERQGTQVHPADLDDGLCTSAIVSHVRALETRLPFAVDSAALRGSTGEQWAVSACLSLSRAPMRACARR